MQDTEALWANYFRKLCSARKKTGPPPQSVADFLQAQIDANSAASGTPGILSVSHGGTSTTRSDRVPTDSLSSADAGSALHWALTHLDHFIADLTQLLGHAPTEDELCAYLVENVPAAITTVANSYRGMRTCGGCL